MNDKIDLFLCDVQGTYTSNDEINSINRNETINNFIESLNNIIETYSCNILIFCFVSADSNFTNQKYITEFSNAINKYNKNIIIYNISDNNMKLDKINSVIKKTPNIRNIFFADDTEFYHKTINYIISKINKNINIINFKVNNQLNDLINIINIHCLEKKKIKKKKNT